MKVNKITILGMILSLSVLTLTGCSSNDKSAATEAADGFLTGLKNNDTGMINDYSSSDVASGEFVELYDAAYLKDNLTEGMNTDDIDQNTLTELDSFFDLYSTMIEEYTITEVDLNDDGTATAYVTIKNRFPYDIVKSEETHNKFQEASEKYQEENAEEIANITSEQGSEAAITKVANDLVCLALDVYKQEIDNSEPITYMLAITLAKNEELGSWYVTEIQSYDSSIAGTGAPAKETNTSATESSLGEDSIFEKIPTDSETEQNN